MVESKMCNIFIKYGRQLLPKEENISTAICLITDDLKVYVPRSFVTKKKKDMLTIDTYECSELATCKRDSEGHITYFKATVFDTFINNKGEEVEKEIAIELVR